MYLTMKINTAFIIVFLFIYLSMISFTVSASNKVHTIAGKQFIKWVKSKGSQIESKRINRYSVCSIKNNILKVKRNSNLDPLNKFQPACEFTLFKSTTLSNGWKVQAIKAVSNGLGKWKYKLNPKGTASLKMVITSQYIQAGSKTSHDIKITKIILIGPSSSKSWKEALLIRK